MVPQSAGLRVQIDVDEIGRNDGDDVTSSIDDFRGGRPLDRVRWGVIGLGRFGAVHARVLASLPEIELVAACTRRPDRLHSLAYSLNVAARFTDYRELLAAPDIDAVSITTHWLEHAEIACAALASGKHVLLEKPMATTSAECRAILQAWRHAPGYLMIGHVCRFDPRVTVARQAILDGRIGRITAMRSRRNLPVAPGSVRLDKISPLMGDGVHDADLMMWLLGRPPKNVLGHTLRVGEFVHPDAGWATLDFGNAVGHIEVNWSLPPNVPTGIDAEFEIVGTAGSVRISCDQSGLAILDEQGLRFPDTAYWPEQHGRTVGALVNEVAYFARCIREKCAPEVIAPIDAARAVAVMEAAEQSARTRQWVNYLDQWE